MANERLTKNETTSEDVSRYLSNAVHRYLVATFPSRVRKVDLGDTVLDCELSREKLHEKPVSSNQWILVQDIDGSTMT